MKKQLFLLISILYQGILFGQAGLQLQFKLCTQCPNGDQQNIDYTYGDTSSYTTSHVESDYDMRVTTGTKFHQGIDYLPRAACRGDAVLSVEAGTVAFVKGNGRLKNIVVQNGNRAFVYMHIFRSDGVGDGMRSGDFILQAVGSEYTILNMNASPAIAYARTSGLRVIYKRYSNSAKSDTVYTTNQVASGAMIAPIGDSETNEPHLHIALIEAPKPFQNNHADPAFQGGRDPDRSIDPWTELAHADNDFSQRLRTRKPGNFSLDVCEHPGPGTDAWGQASLSYASDTRNTIEVEVAMENAAQAGDASRYSNTVMDQEEVVLGIKRLTTDNDFQVTKGSDFDSKFIINPVGTKTIYPARMYDNHGGVYGNPTTNGISPFTYRDGTGFHPHDHYFISDFYTRLHKLDKQLPDKVHKLAVYPWDAYYPDGDYQFRSNVLDVDSTWRAMPTPISFEIDNFKPFVRRAGVYVKSGNGPDQPIYYREWNNEAGQKAGDLRLSAFMHHDPSSTNVQTITVYAWCSASRCVPSGPISMG